MSNGMANYSPEFIAAVRHDYEHADMTLAEIAAKHGVSERTVNRMRDREGWARRSDRVRDLPPAAQALQEATKLLVEQQVPTTPDPRMIACDGAASLPPPERGTSASPSASKTRVNALMASRVGVNDDAALRPPPQPTPIQGEGAHHPSCTAIERIERLVERELEAEEAARKTLGPLPRAPADAERCARTLATLTQTLHALSRLRSGLSPDNGLSDDDMPQDLPRDIDEFRREFARRIRLFVQSRTGGRVSEGGATPGGAAGEP
jgi:transposase-like protein